MTQPDPAARGYNEAEIVAAEEQFDALIDAGITAMVATAVAAVLAEPITSTVTDAVFAPLFTLWDAYTAEVLVPALTRTYLGSADMFLFTLTGTDDRDEQPSRLMLSYDLDTDLPVLDEPAAVWMAAASNRLRNVGVIVWEEIRDQLVEGVQAGDSIPELAARVEQAAGFAATRAVKTARTEVAAASNGGSITQARALGLDMDKRWEATVPTDGRTRLTHIEAHGQTVDLNDKFVVGDSLLDFPADPTGEAKEIIQCRCVPTFVNIRRRAEMPVVAAVFDEAKHSRDNEGKFADQAEDLGVLTAIAGSYGPIEHELEWGDQESGTVDPVYGWLTVHENGDSVLSVYSEDKDDAQIIMDSGDGSDWTELADRIDRVRGMWENSDPDETDREDERQAIDGIGNGEDGDIGVAYDKNGLINLYTVDQGDDNIDLWLDDAEVESLISALEEGARIVEEAQAQDDEDDTETAAAGTVHTGAMIALVPSEEHTARLAVDGGEPAEELHLTVMYLGDAADISEDIRAGLYSVAAAYAASTAPIEGDGFAVEVFNPHNPDVDTALVMGVGGRPLTDLHAGVSDRVGKLMTVPDNHSPWRPHVTLAYSDDLGQVPGFVDKLGPVMFDRLRVAMGGDVTDYPLTGPGGNDFDVEGWAVGNAGKLRLGQPGGFRRCVKRLRNEPGVFDPEGLCATMHHRATGKWPGEGHIVTAAASDDMPGPDQLAAALAYEEELATAVPGAHFHTLMHTEGVSTGRRVQMPGSWTWRTPPIPFNWEKRTAMHGGVPEVVSVGLVTDIARMGREIHGWGMIDLDDPHGLEYARKLAEGWVRGVSVGPDEQPMDLELVYSPSDPEQVIQEVYHSGNIYEVTSSDGVAQATAYVEPLPALIEALAERGIEVARAAFEETKHKRDNGGKFAKKAGGGVPSADAAPPAAKAAKEPKAPRAPRAPRTKTPAKKAPAGSEPKAAAKAKPGTVGALIRPSGSKAAARKNPKATAAAAAAMNGTFGGVEVRVDKATQSGGQTKVEASLYDADGNKVGKTERTFHRGNGDDPDALWVSHDLLALEKDQQGAGFAQEWNAHTEKWYRDSGVSHIRLEANIDVGGYAWARQGYDFADQATAEKIRDRVAGILDSLTFELDFASPGTPQHDRALARAAGAQDLLDRFNNNEYGSADYPTPLDVADAGRQPGQGRADQWFGKLALLNSKWDGVKWL